MNLQGDVVKLITSSGSVVASYTYNAWGENLGVTDKDGNALAFDHIGNVNPMRYRGYYYDRETGLYYLQSRYYDPILKDGGRFSVLMIEDTEPSPVLWNKGNKQIEYIPGLQTNIQYFVQFANR